MKQNFYWQIAINAASCAASPVAGPVPTVIPVPVLLIGFRTRREQRRVQSLLLNAPLASVQDYLKSLPPRIKAGEVGYYTGAVRVPPISQAGLTAWYHIRSLT
jgi:hypothetical protein